MTEKIKPRYPVYIPSKGRYKTPHTARFLIQDNVPFYMVVEQEEREVYTAIVGEDRLLILPKSNQGLIYARNWIKQHALDAGYLRHWQLDDNILRVRRLLGARRIPCAAGVALSSVEDFVDRYENIAIAGLNYQMFAYSKGKGGLPPFYLNIRIYSCSLVLNSLPHRWRTRYNDDVDICLQVLADGWCTVLINVFIIEKLRTMTVKGGNTDDLYQDDGRLKMARSLERLWPGVVKTGRRFKRPQHIVKDSWRRFDTPLKLKPGINLDEMKPNEYGMKLVQVAPEIKSESLRKLVEENNRQTERAEGDDDR